MATVANNKVSPTVEVIFEIYQATDMLRTTYQ